MIVHVKNRQTIFDLLIQHTGSIESLIDVMNVNGILSLSDELPPNIELLSVVNKKVVDFYKQNEIEVATGSLGIMETLLSEFSNEFNYEFN